MRVTQASAHRLGELITQEFKFLGQKKYINDILNLLVHITRALALQVAILTVVEIGDDLRHVFT